MTEQFIKLYITLLHEQHNFSYLLHMDQNTAFWSKSYYQGGAWTLTKPKYIAICTSVMKNFAQSQGICLFSIHS